MAYNIALQFEDGVTRIIPCDANELVADAAYRAKINIPLDCRDGACGTCKCHCESGDYTLGVYIDQHGLPAGELLLDSFLRRPVQVPVDLRPLQELPGGDVRLELRAGQEPVLDAVLLRPPGRAGRRRHHPGNPRFPELFRDRALPDPRRPGDHEQSPPTQRSPPAL